MNLLIKNWEIWDIMVLIIGIIAMLFFMLNGLGIIWRCSDEEKI